MTQTTPPESESLPGATRARARQNAFIVAFIALQVAVPLTFYLGDRGYDERFSWRMFSTLRMQECKSRVLERTTQDGAFTQVALGRDVQVAWVNLLERDRTAVVAKYLERRCEAGALEARYVRKCRDTDGTRIPELRRILECESGALRSERDEEPTEEPTEKPTPKAAP